MAQFSPLKVVAGEKYKVVIGMHDRSVVKGYFCAESDADDIDVLIRNSNRSDGEPPAQYFNADGSTLRVDWPKVKAVFFVSSFEGDRKRPSVRFYADGPTVESIWVEITFLDGEVIEGCVSNSLRHLQNDGFILYPSTPYSNDLLIYVNKSSLLSYRVLGVRMADWT
jgi:hypothetical protein